jgi:hypothetical protein
MEEIGANLLDRVGTMTHGRTWPGDNAEPALAAYLELPVGNDCNAQGGLPKRQQSLSHSESWELPAFASRRRVL